MRINVQTDCKCPADKRSGKCGARAFQIRSAAPIRASKFIDTGCGRLAETIELSSVIIVKRLKTPSLITSISPSNARNITRTLAIKPN